jgi:hypothetical protein
MNAFSSRKPFAWSPSALKDFETCARRYFHTRIAKDFREAESEQLAWGNRFHDTIAARMDPVRAKPLPPELAEYEPWAQRFGSMPGKLIVEQQRAMTKEFQPTGWFDRNAWLRVVIDLLFVRDDGAALLLDWKTGSPSNVDDLQLYLSALMTFVYHPEVSAIGAGYCFIRHDNHIDSITLSRAQVPATWEHILPRVRKMNHAYDTKEYPARPGKLCARWCPVASCEHHGKRQ